MDFHREDNWIRASKLNQHDGPKRIPGYLCNQWQKILVALFILYVQQK